MPVQVIIEDHELEAMRQLVIHVRAVADILGGSVELKYRNWAQMLEDVISRIETQ